MSTAATPEEEDAPHITKGKSSRAAVRPFDTEEESSSSDHRRRDGLHKGDDRDSSDLSEAEDGEGEQEQEAGADGEPEDEDVEMDNGEVEGESDDSQDSQEEEDASDEEEEQDEEEEEEEEEGDEEEDDDEEDELEDELDVRGEEEEGGQQGLSQDGTPLKVTLKVSAGGGAGSGGRGAGSTAVKDRKKKKSKKAKSSASSTSSDESDGFTAIASRKTARQRAKDNEDLQATLLELPLDDPSKKKQLTESEIALRRSETARRRKNQSDKKLEDDKVETINRLLKKQVSRSRTKDRGGEAGGGEGGHGFEFAEAHKLSRAEEKALPGGFFRYISGREGSSLSVPLPTGLVSGVVGVVGGAGGEGEDTVVAAPREKSEYERLWEETFPSVSSSAVGTTAVSSDSMDVDDVGMRGALADVNNLPRYPPPRPKCSVAGCGQEMKYRSVKLAKAVSAAEAAGAADVDRNRGVSAAAAVACSMEHLKLLDAS